jgi:hypothetical protein
LRETLRQKHGGGLSHESGYAPAPASVVEMLVDQSRSLN